MSHQKKVEDLTGIPFEHFDLIMLALNKMRVLFDSDLVRRYYEVRRYSTEGRNCRYAGAVARAFVVDGEFEEARRVIQALADLTSADDGQGEDPSSPEASQEAVRQKV